MRSHPERTRGDSLCPLNAVGEGRHTPAAHTLEGWYPRKYAYCTIYRK